MIRNYLKTALRKLARQKTYTLINMAGLAIGLAVGTMIFLIIQYQTSFDTFHANKDRIYRVLTGSHQPDGTTIAHSPNVPFPLPTGLKTAFPQLEAIAPIYASHNDQLQVLDDNGAPLKSFRERQGVFYTTPSFFSLFDFPLLAGSYTSLKDPNNVLLTKETAETYFGDWKTAIGKSIKLTGSYRIGAGLFQSPPIALKVSGILANIPATTDFQLKIVIAFGTDFTGDPVYGLQQPDWKQTSPDFGCYVLLPPGTSADGFNRQLSNYSATRTSPGSRERYTLQPVDEVHYDTQTPNYSQQTISREKIDGMWIIATFILLIACVNFINLATAQAVNRAKEVGVRKVLGSSRYQLQLQFIVETLLIVTGAVLLAVAMVLIALPAINRVLELSISFQLLNDPSLIAFLLIVSTGITLLAGSYPAFVLSRLHPVDAFKSKFRVNTARSISLRSALVVFQFVIAQALIIATLVTVQQMNYFSDQPLGFDKEAIVQVPFRPDNTGDKLTGYLQQELLSLHGVQAVSYCSNTPVDEDNDTWTTFKFDHAAATAGFQALLKFADTGYLSTYQLQLVAGRALQPSGMTKELLVNESFARKLGFTNPEDILNKEVSLWNDLIKCPVVGVLKDFNNRSLQHDLAPMIISTNGTMYRQIAIKLSTTNVGATLQAIQKTWERSFPGYVYEFRFMDDKINSFYRQERQLSQLYQSFSAIAILLSCLGLYGLAAFMAVQRTKEVGIRKILGASALNILYLFSKEYTRLIILALLIATPIAWYYLHHWLQQYPYRVPINAWVFAAGGLMAVGIALTTISFQVIKAALADPVKSLQTE